jgi:redox-sensitive bicupin YhaK (pirin superfamily)
MVSQLLGNTLRIEGGRNLVEISRIIDPRTRDLGGGFVVRRVLPFHAHRSVGPFVFFDHFGPVNYIPGSSFDVRPHPHIGLSTVTFLFDGAIRHRDSLGNDWVIEAGAVNWMTAGQGIVHSERTPEAQRRNGQTLHGLQTWVALPRDEEDCPPDFVHHPADSLPAFPVGEVNVKVLAGSAWGHASPVNFPWPILYVALETEEDATVMLPAGLAVERALYVVTGKAVLAQTLLSEGRMAVLEPGADVEVALAAGTKAVVCGGAPIESPRKIDWNFVSSDAAKIEQAKKDWMSAMATGGSARFPLVPGDEDEWIALPD